MDARLSMTFDFKSFANDGNESNIKKIEINFNHPVGPGTRGKTLLIETLMHLVSEIFKQQLAIELASGAN